MTDHDSSHNEPSLFLRRPNLDDLPEIPPLPNGMVLRALRPDDENDWEQLATLMRRAFEDEHWTSAKIREALFEDKTVVATFVIELDGEIVATASSRVLPDQYPGSGYVHWVASDPAQRGKRLGFLVTLATLDDFRERGLTDAVLETDDFRLPAIRVYEQLGFQPEMRHGSHPSRWARIRRAQEKSR